MRALVTGHRGFLGRRFWGHLCHQGWQVDGCDTAPGTWPYRGDARNLFRSSDRYDLVVHCAAVVGGRRVIDGDPLAQAVNLELDAALFAWARAANPRRIVYLSSPAAYPVALQTAELARPLREDDIDPASPGLPDRLYGWAKLTGEYLARLAVADGLPVTVVRPFSGYGEDQSPDYPFAAFAARAARREDPFAIWGGGGQVRDWIHADDIAAAALALCDAKEPGPVNLGTGRGTSMTELAGMFCEQAGYRPRFETRLAEPSGVAWRVADPARMLAFHRPRITLAEGIARALDHQARNAR